MRPGFIAGAPGNSGCTARSRLTAVKNAAMGAETVHNHLHRKLLILETLGRAQTGELTSPKLLSGQTAQSTPCSSKITSGKCRGTSGAQYIRASLNSLLDSSLYVFGCTMPGPLTCTHRAGAHAEPVVMYASAVCSGCLGAVNMAAQ